MVFANKHLLCCRINSQLIQWCTNGSFGVLWNLAVLFLGFRGSVFDRYCQLYHILSGNLSWNVILSLFNNIFSNSTIMDGRIPLWLMEKHCQHYNISNTQDAICYNQEESLEIFWSCCVVGKEIWWKRMTNWERFYWKCVKVANLSKM